MNAPLQTSSAVSVPRIDAVLFDYGQVLSRGPNALAWERMRETIGGSSADFHEAYWRSRLDYDRGTLNGTAYWTDVAKAAGHAGLDGKELDSLYQADVDLWTDLNDPMVDWAGKLQRRGIRTGILSNIGDRMEMGLRDRFSWIDNFHHCTWSHRLNMAKPDGEIYRYAAQGLATGPENVLFIDDREENVEGARLVGMIAIQYTTHDAFLRGMRQLQLGDLL